MVKQLNETISFGNSTLSRMQEEAIATVVAVANQCRYGALTHGGFLRRHSGDPELASHLLYDYTRADLDPQNRRMLDFAVRLTREPGSLTAQDLEGLRRAGFDQEAIVSIVLITCLFNFMNRLATGFGVEVPPGYRNVVASWLSGPAAQESWLLPPVGIQSEESPSGKLELDVSRSQQKPAGQGWPHQEQQDAGQGPAHGQQSETGESQFTGDQHESGKGPLRRDPQHAGQGTSAGDQQGRADYPSRTDQHESRKGPLRRDPQHAGQGTSAGDQQGRADYPSRTDQHESRIGPSREGHLDRTSRGVRPN